MKVVIKGVKVPSFGEIEYIETSLEPAEFAQYMEMVTEVLKTMQLALQPKGE